MARRPEALREMRAPRRDGDGSGSDTTALKKMKEEKEERRGEEKDGAMKKRAGLVGSG